MAGCPVKTTSGKSAKVGRPRNLSVSRMDRLIEDAIVDAYGEDEERTGFLTMLEDNLGLPFETVVLCLPVVVEKLELGEAEEIVDICRRGRSRQAVPILVLPNATSRGCRVDPGVSSLDAREVERHWIPSLQ